MNASRPDDSCPYEWAEYNVPQEMRSATKAISPFARMVLDAARAAEAAGSASTTDGQARRTGSDFGSLLLPGLGFPLPKL